MNELYDKIFASYDAKETLRKICIYGKNCNSILEFGTRGGVSGLALYKAMKEKSGFQRWKPRFIGVDLVRDESIAMLEATAEKMGISFQFVQCHTKQYPLHEVDGFVWDTFHCGGNLLVELEKFAPYVNKYIFLLGIRTFENESEAILRKLDIENVARELFIPPDEVKKGMKKAVDEFLQKHNEWKKVDSFGEVCVLERIEKPLKRLFPNE